MPTASAACASASAWVQVTPGTEAAREGERGCTMYLVGRRRGRGGRAGTVVVRIHPGQHFGELGLVVGEARAATVRAVTALTLAALTEDSYRTLAAEHPQVALRLLEAIVVSARTQLTDMTDSVGTLGQERSPPRRTHVAVRLHDAVVTVPTGTMVGTSFAVHPRRLSGGGGAGRPAAGVAGRAPGVAVRDRAADHRVGRRRAHPPPRRRPALARGRPPGRAQPAACAWATRSASASGRWSGAVRPAAAGAGRAARGRDDSMVADYLPVREEHWHVDEAREHFREVGWHDADLSLETWTTRWCRW